MNNFKIDLNGLSIQTQTSPLKDSKEQQNFIPVDSKQIKETKIDLKRARALRKQREQQLKSLASRLSHIAHQYQSFQKVSNNMFSQTQSMIQLKSRYDQMKKMKNLSSKKVIQKQQVEEELFQKQQFVKIQREYLRSQQIDRVNRKLKCSQQVSLRSKMEKGTLHKEQQSVIENHKIKLQTMAEEVKNKMNGVYLIKQNLMIDKRLNILKYQKEEANNNLIQALNYIDKAKKLQEIEKEMNDLLTQNQSLARIKTAEYNELKASSPRSFLDKINSTPLHTQTSQLTCNTQYFDTPVRGNRKSCFIVSLNKNKMF